VGGSRQLSHGAGPDPQYPHANHCNQRSYSAPRATGAWPQGPIVWTWGRLRDARPPFILPWLTLLSRLTMLRPLFPLLLTILTLACKSGAPASSARAESGEARYAELAAACAAGEANVCFEAGNMVFTLSTSELEPCVGAGAFCIRPGEEAEAAKKRLDEESVESFGNACEADIAEGCSNAGSVLAILGTEKSDEEYGPIAARAEAYFERGCNLGSKSGCMFRGSTTRAE
jgi:hypothetical protein